MVKLLKILFRTIGIALEWVLIGLIFIVFAIRTSEFQTFVAQKATNYFSKELKTKISIEKVDFIFFNRLALDGVFILDTKNDTLADLKTIFVKVKSFSSEKKKIHIDEVKLKKGNIKIYKEKKSGAFNFQFISDYFASEDTTTSEPFKITLNKINLSKINFKYDDYQAEKMNYGMDFNHLHFQNLYVYSSQFNMLKDGGINIFVKHLSFKEQSGLNLNRFSSLIYFDSKGLRMQGLRMQTPQSKIHFSKLFLNVDKLEDFSEFVDKVVFDMKLEKSTISAKDISYFVPDMEGMVQKIDLEATITKRIKDLKIADFDLWTGKKTRIRGDFNLPDFRNLEEAFFDERIQFANIDLKDVENILLPKSSSPRKIVLASNIKALKRLKINDLRIDGMYSNFVVKADAFITALGEIDMENGILFAENKNRNSFTFEKSSASDYDVKIKSFQLGKFIDNKDIGILSGQFFLAGEIYNNGTIDFNVIQGELKQFDYLNYAYNNITIKEGSFVNNVFDGRLDIKDDNLNLTYNGLLDFNTKQHFQFDIDIAQAVLNNLHLSSTKNSSLKSAFSVNISGTNTGNYSGEVRMKGFVYKEGNEEFDIPSLVIQMDRSEKEDILSITSAILNAYVKGKVDFATIADDINNQFSVILPAIFNAKKVKTTKAKNKFEYNFEFKNTEDILSVFVPELSISSGTNINGLFDGYTNDFTLNLNSNRIKYEDFVISDLVVKQNVHQKNLDVNYTMSRFELNDSLSVDNLSFIAVGENDELDSELKWNPGTENETFFSWKTIVNDFNSYFFNINPSYFVIKHHKWDILDNSQVLLAPKDIQIQNFKMQRDNQYLTIDGCISEQQKDILKVDIHDLQLDDFSSLLGLPMEITGQLNGAATISDPFNNMAFTSDIAVRDLFINKEEVGDINVKAGWGKAASSIDLSGELFYKKNKTLNFDGRYFLERKVNSLDFNIGFDYTDLQFTNAFMDPQVVSGIRGLLDGDLKISGTPETPVIEGAINLLGGNAKVEMFGVNFGFNGEVFMDKDGIYIDNMPLMDEEGNSGSLIGTVFHNNFSNFNFDLNFNLEDDSYTNNRQKLDRFLVMNTKYKEGEIYYGKAYVGGSANVFGYADKLDITVNLETKKGTQINFPMYGTSDIGEDKFITFTPKDGTTTNLTQPKIDFSGVSMALNFKVTPDAQLKIIFDETLGDEITAFGEGDMAIKLDEIGEVEMIGDYTITKGSVYNFVMPPVKQAFIIEEGGTIIWTGDPVNARLNLKTYASIETSLSDIDSKIESGSSSQNKEVKCYLNLSETLLNPVINFDIKVPKANESENVSLNRIKSNPDDLNKQFFSLLLFKKFQPLQGNVSAGAGAAYDLAAGQINDVLAKVSGDDMKLKVDLTSASKTLDVSKNLYNDRLILKTSVGVETGSAQNASSFIGDVNLEYLINEEGTFRVSIFNESNDNTIIQDKNLGQFTQGAGLNYREEFNNFHDFQMAQYFLDLFRDSDNKRYPIKKKSRQIDIPTDPKDSK